MSAISDDRLVAQMEHELSQPEPGLYYGATLIIGTLVASPVLLAGATGRHPVPLALAVYAGVLIVVWFLAGLFGSVLSMKSPEGSATEEAEADLEPALDPELRDRAAGSVPSPPEQAE